MNDKTIGDILAEAMDKVGKEGVITVEEAKGLETTLDLVEGMRFDRGYLSPYFVTDPEPSGNIAPFTHTDMATGEKDPLRDGAIESDPWGSTPPGVQDATSRAMPFFLFRKASN